MHNLPGFSASYADPDEGLILPPESVFYRKAPNLKDF